MSALHFSFALLFLSYFCFLLQCSYSARPIFIPPLPAPSPGPAVSVAASNLQPQSDDGQFVIVFMDEKPRVTPEKLQSIQLQTLAKVLGSLQAARHAILYHYVFQNAFAAKLTKGQIEALEKQRGVLGISQDEGGIIHAYHEDDAPRP